MSLLSEAKGLTVQTGGRCTVYLLAKTLEPAEAEELREAIAADVQSTAIARALAARGHTLNSLAIQRHRRGDCRCR